MRFLLTFITALILVAAPASAEEVLVTTKVARVELHPDGARIFRSFELDLPAGRHRLEFRDISDSQYGFDLSQIGSLEISLGGADATIIGFSFKQDGLKPSPLVESVESQRALDDFKAAQQVVWNLEGRQSDLGAEIKAAKAQLAYLDSIRVNRPAKGEAAPITATDISANTATIGQEYLGALRTIQKAEQAIGEMEIELARARSEAASARIYWDSFESRRSDDFAVYYEVDLASAYAGAGTISTLSDEAGWKANYELRLTQNGASGTAIIQRKALIVNGTGSNWSDVQATLSTARIDVETATYDPTTRIGRVFNKPKPKKTASRSASQPVMEPTVMVEDSSSTGMLDSEPPTLKGQVLEFSLPRPLSAKAESVGFVWLDQLNLDVDLSLKIVPSFDENAFLIARLRNTTSGPVLPGSVFIYRDGAYIGEGQISAVGIGEEFELSFGEYDGIEVNRDLVEKFDSDIGIISSTNKRVLRYRTTITSNLGFSMPVRVLGNVPVSETEELKIRMLANPQPTQTDVDGKRGVVAWEFDLPSGSTKRIDLGYDAQWPPDMDFTIR
jgi:uncharacterized protein (TIGR02231 family)